MTRLMAKMRNRLMRCATQHGGAPRRTYRGQGGGRNVPRRATTEVEHVVVHGTAGGSLIARTVVQHEGGNWGPSNNNSLPPNKPPNDGIGFLDMADPPNDIMEEDNRVFSLDGVEAGNRRLN
nr:hypothetical protein Iba_chr14bCG12100 [Ipomoea batatas]